MAVRVSLAWSRGDGDLPLDTFSWTEYSLWAPVISEAQIIAILLPCPNPSANKAASLRYARTWKGLAGRPASL